MKGYPRSDGRKGIRNLVVVAYLVECSRHVAAEIVAPMRGKGVHLIGFPGCFPNDYADRMMTRICTHPNVGAVLLVGLGCEGFDDGRLRKSIADSGRPVERLVIQESGGTTRSIERGREWVRRAADKLRGDVPVDMKIDEMVVATICGGSDASSGLTANPAVGRAFDRLLERGATAIFEETGELIGCEQLIAPRAANETLGRQIVASIEKAARYYAVLGHGSFAPGNADGGLTTIEEKSLGAYCKSGDSTISGIIRPGEIPPRGGLYLLDIIPDDEPRFGFPNICDNAEIGELMACGAHLSLFTTGRGTVVGSAVSPVIKICANPETYRHMSNDMDIDAGRILEGQGTLDEVADEIIEHIEATVDGQQTASERLGHQEFILTYKSAFARCR
ncbi:MAG: UxaA family hydrolase [Planctomycetota bacterium]|nr:UxaA family hydrolase [Planctomycetota bacterium]